MIFLILDQVKLKVLFGQITEFKQKLNWSLLKGWLFMNSSNSKKPETWLQTKRNFVNDIKMYLQNAMTATVSISETLHSLLKTEAKIIINVETR